MNAAFDSYNCTAHFGLVGTLRRDEKLLFASDVHHSPLFKENEVLLLCLPCETKTLPFQKIPFRNDEGVSFIELQSNYVTIYDYYLGRYIL